MNSEVLIIKRKDKRMPLLEGDENQTNPPLRKTHMGLSNFLHL
jgi:hypothetical protein